MNYNRGLIRTLIVIIIALVILKIFFGFDAIKYVTSEDSKKFFSGIWNLVVIGWEYLIGIFS